MRHFLLAVTVVVLHACAGVQSAVITPVAGVAEDADFTALVREADEEYEGRLEQERLRKALDLYEAAYAIHATDANVLDHLAIGYFQLGYAYMKEDADKQAAFERGRQFALKRLEMHPGYYAVVQNGGSMKEAVASIDDKAFVHALQFASANWGRWAEIQGISKVAFDIPKVRALFEKAMELDPDFLCHAPRLMAAAFYAKAGAFGGDMEKARELYEVSIQEEGCYDNKMYYAEFYAIPMDERDLYFRLVSEVAAAPEDATSLYRLENRTAKEKAAKFLAEIDNHF